MQWDRVYRKFVSRHCAESCTAFLTTLLLVKNFKTKCEGLSPALFLFAIAGNVTYALSICAASMEREYLVRNGSWLAGKYMVSIYSRKPNANIHLCGSLWPLGSALTVFLDIFVSEFSIAGP